ncbi:alpha-(1,3)-fucosyltransferase 10-like [Platysternon megacephalum]|uniref:Alpha-(1,3)-fucosyltransferase 10-like n=1 Tax=Platysternon megacephalum TaxID=55544 RepID=A0A4D9E015_9SAUR|nr:alpha-(1,3)-fucosyltransferase 10-like [Platysternon megacephalum]
MEGNRLQMTQETKMESDGGLTGQSIQLGQGCKGKSIHVASRAEHEPDDLTVLVHVKQEIEARQMPFAIYSNSTNCKKITEKDKFTVQTDSRLSCHSNKQGKTHTRRKTD